MGTRVASRSGSALDGSPVSPARGVPCWSARASSARLPVPDRSSGGSVEQDPSSGSRQTRTRNIAAGARSVAFKVALSQTAPEPPNFTNGAAEDSTDGLAKRRVESLTHSQSGQAPTGERPEQRRRSRGLWRRRGHEERSRRPDEAMPSGSSMARPLRSAESSRGIRACRMMRFDAAGRTKTRIRPRCRMILSIRMDKPFPQGVCGCCGKPPFGEGENYVVTDSGCWEWIGSKDANGYGRLTYRHIRWAAHRLSYILATGEDPDNKAVHHVCENKACINPDHLELVDQRDHFNNHRTSEWYAKRKAKPIPPHVREIRRLHHSGNYSVADLATKFGESKQNVSRYILHQRYPCGRAPRHYERPSYWQEIPTLYATGKYSQSQLAQMFRISQSMVSKVIRVGRHTDT